MLVTHRPETIFQGWLYLTFCLWWVCARIVLLFLMKVLEVLLYLCFWLEVLGIFSLCGVTESVRNFAAHCLLGQFCYNWTFLLKIWQFYYIYPIFKMLLFYPIFLFLYLTYLLKVWPILVHLSFLLNGCFGLLWLLTESWGYFSICCVLVKDMEVFVA